MNDTTTPATPTWFVGVGASAGGIEAVGELLAHVPARSGMAYLIVIHLDRTHSSQLPEILARNAPVRVSEAVDGTAIEPDVAYVITPNTTLAVADGRLVVRHRAEEVDPHMPVDDLFSSIARESGAASAAIVLSGTGTDGALGVTEVKAAGGVTFAQDAASARFDGMPNAAINSGAIDFVLTPRDIAAQLEEIARSPGARAVDESRALANAEDWKRLFRMLRGMSGVDFSHYKRTTLRRRLARRMSLRRADTLEQYLEILQREPAELDALYQDLLIRVTGFFRDPVSYDGLREIVFPRLVEMHAPGETIRIWVPGCSTGEEVYSLAISLLEYLQASGERLSVQIFGTDVNPRSVERARAGRYIANLFADVPQERIAPYFTRIDGVYEVNKSVRDLCIFAEHNVTRDPPFSRLDLVSCRNLLIYLDPNVQKRVLQFFHYALAPERFLVLGPSETAGIASDLFEVVDASRKLYRRIGPARAAVTPRFAGPAVVSIKRREPNEPPAEIMDVDYLQREADHVLLARFAPAGILVDHAMNVLQFRGNTADVVEHQPGAASLSLATVVRPGLLVEISNAIEEARVKGLPARREQIRNERSPGRHIHLEVIPLNSRREHPQAFLILFEEAERAARPASEPAFGDLVKRFFDTRARPDPDSAEARERDELKRELEGTRTYLQAIIEANEVAQQELRSANEEVLSANEEFQSTNEELETAKEELQSSNEELATTNEELRHRNLELSELNVRLRKAHDYTQAVVEAVRQPLLLLDGELRVRRVNRAFCETFLVTRADAENCLFRDLAGGHWEMAKLREAVDDLTHDGAPMVNVAFRKFFPELGDRVLRVEGRKLRGDPQYGELLLLALDDVTERDRLARALAQYATIVDLCNDAVIVHDFNGPIRSWNRAAAHAFGWPAEDAIGKSAELLLKTRRATPYQQIEAALEREGTWHGEQVHIARDGREVRVHARYALKRDEDGIATVIEIDRVPQ